MYEAASLRYADNKTIKNFKTRKKKTRCHRLTTRLPSSGSIFKLRKLWHSLPSHKSDKKKKIELARLFSRELRSPLFFLPPSVFFYFIRKLPVFNFFFLLQNVNHLKMVSIVCNDRWIAVCVCVIFVSNVWFCVTYFSCAQLFSTCDYRFHLFQVFFFFRFLYCLNVFGRVSYEN